MNSRTRFVLSIGIPVLLILVVVGVFLEQQYVANSTSTRQGPQSSKPLKTMTLALDWTPNTDHTGIYVALQQGWYREQGIDLNVLPYSSSTSPDVLVSSGKADVGISSTEGVVSDAGVGQPVVSIAAIIQHNTSALVTLASSGLTRPSMLDGKVYGGFGAPYENAVIGSIIKHDGGKGTFKNVTISVDALQALESHRIDFAWVIEGVEGVQAQHDGIKLNVFPVTDFGIPDYYTPTIITSPTEIKQQSTLLHQFMAATTRGYDYARTHVQQSAQLLMQATPKGTFPDQSYVQASQEFLSPRYAEPGRQWGRQDAAAWHDYPQFMLDAGAVTDASGKPVRSMNFDALYTNQFLP